MRDDNLKQKFIVRVPATTANLGPGFDSLGLALDLWNEASFSISTTEEAVLQLSGEGEDTLAADSSNLIYRAALRIFALTGNLPAPPLKITCRNLIPLGSGLGSSAAAVLTGILGGNALCHFPLSEEEILMLATEMEGHPDNVAPGLLGSLVISTSLVPEPTEDRPKIIARRVHIPPLEVAVVVPKIDLPTKTSRAALPLQVAIRDAVFNLGRTALVVEALRNGDLDLLGKVMEDRLHQPYRLKLIPGAEEALRAARLAGAAATALSGAGPGIVAFSMNGSEKIAAAMVEAFASVGVEARQWVLGISEKGAAVLLRS